MGFSLFNAQLQQPWFLLLFLLFIPLLLRDYKKKKKSGILVPTTANMQGDSSIVFIMFLLRISKYVLLSSLIIALARPRTFTVIENRDDTKGLDIILTVDVSLSMLSRDLEPDRLVALKGIAKQFVEKRVNDRIGVVAYSAEAFTKVPVTSDHQVVLDELELLNPFELEPGTAIGEGLTVAVNHLKDSKAKSKIIILMTDGVNTIENAMDPLVAAQIAKTKDIKVYSIGIGTNGYALMPTQTDVFGDLIFTEAEVRIDEGLLQDVAEITGGKYFRATSNESLAKVYDQIDQLEKSDVKSTKLYSYKEYFRIFLWIALFIIILDALLRWVLFKFLN